MSATDFDSSKFLDLNFSRLDDERLTFLKQTTGITDTEELKKHILEIQAKAYSVNPYPCIRLFSFIMPRIHKNPAYPRFLDLGKSDDGGIFVDLGCFFGTDTRKAVQDGFPASRTITTDLEPKWWDFGKQFFKSPDLPQIPFITGSITDSNFLPSDPPPADGPSESPIDLGSVTSLREIQGRVSAIHESAVIHLFDEPTQAALVKSIGNLLSSKPGSIAFGSHAAKPTKGFRRDARREMFCHSPETWNALWEKELFPEGTFKGECSILYLRSRSRELNHMTLPSAPAEASLIEVPRPDLPKSEETRFWLMTWHVTRL
ncbi:hypothetical protein DL96DRAFT_1703630 [Flagelloscypha sp. PMI_526]|nr:hypothetical protein DL96DRAFT_1703630 [Flagelloscypha sp. PMI_526]